MLRITFDTLERDHLGEIFWVIRECICDLSLMRDLNCGAILRTSIFYAKLIFHDKNFMETLCLLCLPIFLLSVM